VEGAAGTRCITLLVRAPERGAAGGQFGNYSDDCVEDYAYDYCYGNNKPIGCVERDFMDFFRALLAKEGVRVLETEP
jgi:hypothetical protein